MTPETVVMWLLAIGAAARLTRLITIDTLGLPVRAWVARKFGDDHWFAEFVTCPWCVGFWVTAGTVATTVAWGDHTWWQLIAATLTLSYLVAWLVISTDHP